MAYNVADLVQNNTPIGWETVFRDASDEWETIEEVLNARSQMRTVVPEPHNLFRAFHLTPLNKVKVVIFAGEPHTDQLHPSPPLAQGVAFGVKKDSNVPKALQKIYNEIFQEYGQQFRIPTHGCLDFWAQQGVLLLCNSLTAEEGEQMAHGQLWTGFMITVIRALKEANPNCIYVSWGKSAEQLLRYVGDKGTKLTAGHPLAYSGFFGCDHFVEINRILAENQRERFKTEAKLNGITFICNEYGIQTVDEYIDMKVNEEGIDGINWNLPVYH